MRAGEMLAIQWLAVHWFTQFPFSREESLLREFKCYQDDDRGAFETLLPSVTEALGLWAGTKSLV